MNFQERVTEYEDSIFKNGGYLQRVSDIGKQGLQVS